MSYKSLACREILQGFFLSSADYWFPISFVENIFQVYSKNVKVLAKNNLELPDVAK